MCEIKYKCAKFHLLTNASFKIFYFTEIKFGKYVVVAVMKFLQKLMFNIDRFTRVCLSMYIRKMKAFCMILKLFPITK
jgi:hypothetical protein